MSNEIIIISTTSSATKTIESVMRDRDLNYPVYEATMEKAYQISHKEIEDGTKVIICRGGSATYLRKKVDVPVVDIRHGFIDIYLSVKKAERVSPKIAIVGYNDLCEAAKDYINITNEKIPIVEVSNDTEIDKNLKKLSENGIKVVIGGFQLSEKVKKYGISHVMGEADPSAVNQSFDEALHDLKIEKERKEKFETINAILNCTSDGILAVESDGKIIHINEIAKKILGYKEEKYIEQILPKYKMPDDTIETGEYNGEFFTAKNNSIVVNSVPIRMGDSIIGAVATIQEENKIQSIDIAIRKKHLGSGHFAKKTFKDIIGSSESINHVIKRASKYAKTDSTVLIYGETGTGKEVFAQSIHNFSRRKDQPFVAVNCAALPENILESELFGYAKGAFTGARKEGKAGIFELAHRGTVFLDEIGEISKDVQVKLLRVIQEKEVSRIGDDKVIPIDVRILAASNKNLVEEIYKGRFREDLYFRIGVLELNIPPLRERIEDIEELVFHFIKEKNRKKVKFSSEAINVLEEYKWPGNIRQLMNVVERILVISEDKLIGEDIIKEALRNMEFKKDLGIKLNKSESTEVELELIKIIEGLVNEKSSSFRDSYSIKNTETNNEIEKNRKPLDGSVDIEKHLEKEEERIIVDALNKNNGSREKTAEFLGISKTTLWRKMKKFNLE